MIFTCAVLTWSCAPAEQSTLETKSSASAQCHSILEADTAGTVEQMPGESFGGCRSHASIRTTTGSKVKAAFEGELTCSKLNNGSMEAIIETTIKGSTWRISYAPIDQCQPKELIAGGELFGNSVRNQRDVSDDTTKTLLRVKLTRDNTTIYPAEFFNHIGIAAPSDSTSQTKAGAGNSTDKIPLSTCHSSTSHFGELCGAK